MDCVDRSKEKGFRTANVFVRIRPENVQEKKYKTVGNEKYLSDFTTKSLTVHKGKFMTKFYDYPSHVLNPACGQEEAYEIMGIKEVLESFLFEDEDACIIAYGQTGSGKTHTMFGDGITRDEIRKTYGLSTIYKKEFDGKGLDDSTAFSGSGLCHGLSRLNIDDDAVSKANAFRPPGWGIFPRAVTTALEIISDARIKRQSRRDKKVLSATFSACVIEMYFGQVKDLLEKKNVLPVKCTTNENFDFSQAKQMNIDSIKDLQKLVDVVFTKRQSRSTKMNEASSRSHCIATLFLTKILLDEKTGRKFVSRSQMQFVDLSGSERTSKTQVSGRSEIQKSAQGMEGISINLDLWSLGYAVDDRIRLKSSQRTRTNHLTEAQKTAARQRQRAFPSLLCNILSHTTNGETNCAVVMCVSPSAYNGSETAFTVDFGERFSHLAANPQPPVVQDYEELIESLKKYIEENRSSSASHAHPSSLNRMAQMRVNTLAAKEAQLSFLKSLKLS